MNINRNKILKTLGWTTVGLGLCLVVAGLSGEELLYTNPKKDEDIIDVEYTVVD